MTGDEKVKKNRDPIFATCLVIFMLAAVAVVGVYINDHYIAEDSTEISYGDKVTVNYTGSFYDYYGEENAVVFDTSYSSVGNNDKIIKSNSFAKKSYSTLSFTVGGTDVLQVFGDSVVGKKVGDTVKVMVPAADAYPAPEATETLKGGVYEVAVPGQLSKTQFKDLYGVDITAGQSVTFTTVYGWDAVATLDSLKNKVSVDYKVEVGKTYDYTGNEDSDFGKVQFKVTSEDADSVTTQMIVTDYKSVGNGQVQMIEVDVGSKPFYITGVSGSDITVKYCGENNNMDLYFEIEIVSIN